MITVMQPTEKTTMFTLPGIARRWGISYPTIKRAVKAGQIRTLRIGRRQLVHRSEVLRLERGDAAGVAE